MYPRGPCCFIFYSFLLLLPISLLSFSPSLVFCLFFSLLYFESGPFFPSPSVTFNPFLGSSLARAHETLLPRTYTHAHTQTYSHTHTYSRTHILTHIHTHTHTYILTNTHTYSHTHTFTHTHIITQSTHTHTIAYQGIQNIRVVQIDICICEKLAATKVLLYHV